MFITPSELKKYRKWRLLVTYSGLVSGVGKSHSPSMHNVGVYQTGDSRIMASEGGKIVSWDNHSDFGGVWEPLFAKGAWEANQR